MAASADHAAAAARQRPQARPGRRPARRRRARGHGHRAGGDRRGAADPGAARANGSPRPGCARRARPSSICSRWPACAGSSCAARWPGATTPTRWSATGSVPRPRSTRRSTGTGPWPSWPSATWPATARPPTATWPSGPGCRCATPGRAWPRSPDGSPAAATVSPTWPGGRATCPLPPPRLLGAYDPLLLGWDSRDPVVGPHGRLIADQRPVPAVRAGPRPRRRHLEPAGRQGRAGAVRAASRCRRGRPGRGRRRRRALPAAGLTAGSDRRGQQLLSGAGPRGSSGSPCSRRSRPRQPAPGACRAGPGPGRARRGAARPAT